MKQGIYTVLGNVPLTESVRRMTLRGDTSPLQRPGQFVNLKIDGCFLRRPISVCDCAPGDADTGSMTLIYKVVGEGTRRMADALPGQTFDILTGLGNGYDTAKSGEKPLLIGGGVGIPPLYGLCKKLREEKKQVQVILGFRTASEIFLEREFRALGDAVSVTVATEDGSHGVRGFVSDAMKGMDYSYFYTCGPMPMFRAVNDQAKSSGQFSFEERMGCGFGACMGCTCQTKYGNKRICRDGPVLEKEEIVW